MQSCPSAHFSRSCPRIFRELNQKTNELIRRPPLSAAFVKSIRARFSKKNADGILKHLMDKANELIDHRGSGYSEVQLLWDTEKNQEMTPAQKMDFLLLATGGPSHDEDRFKASWKKGHLAERLKASNIRYGKKKSEAANVIALQHRMYASGSLSSKSGGGDSV
jgi:hypothetical protein